MALTSIKNRLKKVQDSLGAADSFHMVAELIARGAYYDELTDEEKAAYVRYKESLGGCDSDLAAARLNEMFYQMDGEKGIDDTPPDQFYHFRLTKRKRAPTPTELEQSVKEVQEIFERIRQEEEQDEA